MHLNMIADAGNNKIRDDGAFGLESRRMLRNRIKFEGADEGQHLS